MLQLGPFDLPPGQGWETRVDMDAPAGGAPPPVDPRPAPGLLDPANWLAATNAVATYARPPAANTTGLVNTALPAIDAAVAAYALAFTTWDVAAAVTATQAILASAVNWKMTNNNPPGRRLIGGNARRNRYLAARALVQQVANQAIAQYQFWNDPANAALPANMHRSYRRPTPADPNPVWDPDHPLDGAGTSRYASILEIVTRPYETETPPGRADLVTAMTEAAQLAAAIEAATGNFANRVPMAGLGPINLLSPNVHIGNAAVPHQTTDASIQSTFAIDLTQIASLMGSTIATMAPQHHFGLQHQADTIAGLGGAMATVNRSEVEMALAVNSATQVVNQIKAAIGGGAPSFVNLRGLLVLMCQYLRMGRHWGVGAQPLDKNLTNLLSRTDLSQIYRRLVPPAERAWIEAAPANRHQVIAWVMAACGRNAASMLLNNPAEARPAGAARPFNLSCQSFANRVLTRGTDGITRNLGGFQRRPDESIDPGGAVRGGDTRPAGAAERMAPVFELRNMIPKLGDNMRFPRTDWVPLAAYLAEAVHLLNMRTEAAATHDARARAAPPPPAPGMAGAPPVAPVGPPAPPAAVVANANPW